MIYSNYVSHDGIVVIDDVKIFTDTDHKKGEWQVGKGLN